MGCRFSPVTDQLIPSLLGCSITSVNLDLSLDGSTRTGDTAGAGAVQPGLLPPSEHTLPFLFTLGPLVYSKALALSSILVEERDMCYFGCCFMLAFRH